MSEAIAYKFTGARAPDGEPLEFHYGIPARDLTKTDFDGLRSELQDVVRASPVYKAMKAADAPKAEPKPSAKTDDSVKTEKGEG